MPRFRGVSSSFLKVVLSPRFWRCLLGDRGVCAWINVERKRGGCCLFHGWRNFLLFPFSYCNFGLNIFVRYMQWTLIRWNSWNSLYNIVRLIRVGVKCFHVSILLARYNFFVKLTRWTWRRTIVQIWNTNVKHCWPKTSFAKKSLASFRVHEYAFGVM